MRKSALDVLPDPVAVLGHHDVRLHHEGGVLVYLAAHCRLRSVAGRRRCAVSLQKFAGLSPMSSSITRAVMVPIAEMPPPGWQCGPVM